ncbi:MAG TPA: hypothetical protein VGB77_21365 [Abditibacteriaceae bacterium]|jgi:hypothetical protein
MALQKLKPRWPRKKRKQKKEAPRALPPLPEFTWCSETEETYSWMNRDLVEFVVLKALEIPLDKWQHSTLDEKSGYCAVTEKGAQVFLRTYYSNGHGRTGRNEYYIYVDGELIGRFTEVRGEFLDYYYGYTGVEYVCRHIAYEIYEIEKERSKSLEEAAKARQQQEQAKLEAHTQQQLESMKMKF